MNEFKQLMAALQNTPYHKWMKAEELPIVEGHGVEDVRDLELRPWRRTGGRGSFIHLYGMEGSTGMYVAEIPPGGALKPEKHLYEEVILILEGNGATEAWQDGGKKHVFEWSRWSLFAPPLNSWHRLVNGGREPVKFLAVTTAPIVMDLYRNPEFIFDLPFVFRERFGEEERYFDGPDKRYKTGRINIWETNFISDVSSAAVEAMDEKGAGAKITQYEIAGNCLIGHISQWPAGLYHKAHYHGPGSILFGLQSSGYVLLWSKDLGIRPYQNEQSEKVVELNWKDGSVYCPPGGWFHQHFNVGTTPARQLAIRFGGRIHPTGFATAAKRHDEGVLVSVRNGGTLIEYEDEDPEIRRRFETALKSRGVRCEMPEFAATKSTS
jgi:oxalate decarboxylase/phosphoglucose isomerase-like protein (cupin superfamily)